MTHTLPRKDELDVVPTMFLRPRNPDDHRQFAEVLPWFTPLFVYRQNGIDWVRWSVPKVKAEQLGLDQNCACCGSGTAQGGVEDYHVDTAWHETDWWLITNGYKLPPELSTPTKEGK